ncbi:MAG: DUF58 domain-containing protein [Myxococcales bacterium]
MPIPTRGAVLAFFGCVAMLAVAFAVRSPSAATLAGGGLLGLSAALALTMPLGARLRRQRLDFAWWHVHGASAAGESGVVVGAPFDVRCYVRNRSGEPLRFANLAPVLPAGVEVTTPGEGELLLPPTTRTELSFRLSARAPGRVVLQGLSVTVPGPFGLFLAPLYFPSPLAVKVLPRTSARRHLLGAAPRGQSAERSGITPLRRPGTGTDLHEIREHRPGDPFKSIAWKPSARAGKLLVREVEREVQETIYLILDISGSMRGGPPGTRKLDHCIEMVALAAREALERGDRVGLITVDGRILSHVPPGEGLRHMLLIYRALLGATEVVDEDLTETDDDEVVALVGRYVRHQEGLDLSSPDAPAGYDLDALARHARGTLDAAAPGEVVASSPQHALLRRYCRERGIPLAYRADTRGFAKAEGLARALRAAAGNSRIPRTMVLLSDLDGVFDPTPLLKTLRLLRARHHHLACVYPDARSLAGDPEGGLEQDLARVYGMQDRRRLAEARALMGRLGIPVIPFGRRDDKSQVVHRAELARRVA